MTTIYLAEVQCLDEGCPPLETGFAVLDTGVDCKWKVQKALMDVTSDDIVDGLQAMLRGDAPPCACDINFERNQNSKKSDGVGGMGNGAGAAAASANRPSDGGPSMEEVEMMGMMDMMSTGTL